MAAPVSFFCRNHPGRQAIGMCVKCRAPICADCTTKVQGINHCLDCLKREARPTETSVRRPAKSLAPLGIAAAFVFFFAVFAALGAAFIANR